MKKLLILLSAGFFLVIFGCGGGGSSPETATVSIGITDNATGYDEVVLTIKEIGIVATDQPTIYYGSDSIDALPVTVNVLDFPAENVFHLADVEVPVPEIGAPLCFDQIRLVLAEQDDPFCAGGYCNYVVETGMNIEQPLFTPSGQQSGVKVLTPNHFCVEAGQTSVELAIDFDPATAIVHNPQKFILKPTGIRIIEGSWQMPPEDFIEGSVRLQAPSDSEGCIPFEPAPIVTVQAWEATDPQGPVISTASMTEGPDAECFYNGNYKLLLPTQGVYDLAAFWDGYSVMVQGVDSGTSENDLELLQGP